MKAVILLASLIATSQLFGETRAGTSASLSTKEIVDPLKVKGQMRHLDMLLTLRNQSDRLKVIKLRKNFRKEVLRTQY